MIILHTPAVDLRRDSVDAVPMAAAARLLANYEPLVIHAALQRLVACGHIRPTTDEEKANGGLLYRVAAGYRVLLGGPQDAILGEMARIEAVSAAADRRGILDVLQPNESAPRSFSLSLLAAQAAVPFGLDEEEGRGGNASDEDDDAGTTGRSRTLPPVVLRRAANGMVVGSSEEVVEGVSRGAEVPQPARTAAAPAAAGDDDADNAEAAERLLRHVVPRMKQGLAMDANQLRSLVAASAAFRDLGANEKSLLYTDIEFVFSAIGAGERAVRNWPALS